MILGGFFGDNHVISIRKDGFAWLDVNFAVDRNPGRNAPAWHYYYLYGLERAAIFPEPSREGIFILRSKDHGEILAFVTSR